VRALLTQCAHCFNTFKNEYPEFGADFNVIHHSQLIEQLIKGGKLRLKPESQTVMTFHDPCYLARYNGVIDTPRNVIVSLGPKTLREMPRSRENSFCCGAGGANFWYKVERKKRVDTIRLEEAQQTGASTIATACPFCTSMLEDATVSAGIKDTISVRDISELVADQIADS
jgi:Fe-S oxidoreductase